MIEASPVVGLAATLKSSYRSRFPVQVTPLSHTPPKWFVGEAVCRYHAEPGLVAVRFCAKPTVHAAEGG